jgi:hypothetical protein
MVQNIDVSADGVLEIHANKQIEGGRIIHYSKVPFLTVPSKAIGGSVHKHHQKRIRLNL